MVIIFHVTAGFFNEIFATHPDSKVIQTLLLLALSVLLIIREPDFFFKRDAAQKAVALPAPAVKPLRSETI